MKKSLYPIITLVSTIYFSGILLLISRFILIKGTRQSYELTRRIICFIYGVYFVIYSTLFLGDFNSFRINHSFPTEFYACLTLGYYIHDIAVCVKFDIYVKRIVLHHSIVCFIIISGLASDIGIKEGVYLYFMTELSSPFLSIKEILMILGHKQSKSYILFQVLYIFSFIFGRFIAGSVFSFMIFMNPDILFVQKALFVCFQCMFLYWSISLIKILRGYLKNLDNIKAMPWLRTRKID